MSLLAAIGGFISSAISVVGPVISTVADVLLNKLPTAIEVAKVVIGTISTVLTKVCELLDITPVDQRADELGAKAMQEGTRAKMEEESTQEYLDYLRNEVELDRERYAKMDETEKINCEALGTSMLAKAIEEKTGVELPPEFLLTIAKARLQYEQVDKMIRAFADNGIKSMGEFTRYISNDMSESEAGRTGEVVKGVIKEMSPGLSATEIQKEIIEMKKNYFAE